VGEADCPACGSATMASQPDERIEIERADGPAAADGPGYSDPSVRADRPSGATTGEPHDESVEPITVAASDDHDHDRDHGLDHGFDHDHGHGHPDGGPVRPDDPVT
jgi:hypothetical protein